MLIASEPFGLMRAARVALVRVEMKYGPDVCETGNWWWELEERARPEYEWLADEARFMTAGGEATEPARATWTTLLGIPVRFVSTEKMVATRREAEAQGGLGRICLHTDRTDLPRDSKLYR